MASTIRHNQHRLHQPVHLGAVRDCGTEQLLYPNSAAPDSEIGINLGGNELFPRSPRRRWSRTKDATRESKHERAPEVTPDVFRTAQAWSCSPILRATAFCAVTPSA